MVMPFISFIATAADFKAIVREKKARQKKEINEVKEETYRIQEAMKNMEDGINKVHRQLEANPLSGRDFPHPLDDNGVVMTLLVKLYLNKSGTLYILRLEKCYALYQGPYDEHSHKYGLDLTTWCDLSKTQQRQANSLHEEHIKNRFSLVACGGYWDARFLMVNFLCF
ncbi:hypothetical protein INT45_010157 [Circinella minor]|uniref:Uncharacterized protein n=1 Tax=Circinella minor TaxID=1195481 RepID=A0A8H7SE92_9FUNG|nr:hypothetical protein INT45_010157 [Circinella minor]